MGQPMIIVNSADIMAGFDKKGSIYSDRPRLELAGELVGYSKTLALLPYGSRLRAYRRHFSRVIGTPKATSNYYDLEEAETHKFLFTVKPGGIAGYLASLSNTASYVDIVAKTDTYVGYLPAQALERLLEKRPIVLLTLAKRLISLLSPLGALKSTCISVSGTLTMP